MLLLIVISRQEDGVLSAEKQGEFVLEVCDSGLFAVVASGGDPSLSYLCIQANRAALFHAGELHSAPCEKDRLGLLSSTVPAAFHSAELLHTLPSGIDTHKNVKVRFDFQTLLKLRQVGQRSADPVSAFHHICTQQSTCRSPESPPNDLEWSGKVPIPLTWYRLPSE